MSTDSPDADADRPTGGHGADAQQQPGCELDGLTAVEDSRNEVGCEKGDGEGAADLADITIVYGGCLWQPKRR